MPKYRVPIFAPATVSGYLEVEAGSKEEAVEEAVEEANRWGFLEYELDECCIGQWEFADDCGAIEEVNDEEEK